MVTMTIGVPLKSLAPVVGGSTQNASVKTKQTVSTNAAA